MSMPQFIYLVTNLVNKKRYVGQTSRTVERRFIEHIRKGDYECNTSLLSKAIKKHGKEKFMIEVIEQFNNITQKELDAAEIKYIKQFDCLMPNGYNKSPGGNVTFLTDDGRERKKIKATQRWQDEDYKLEMLDDVLIRARTAAHTTEANIKRGNSLVNNRRYLITTPDGIEYCTYGLTHLQELGLDVSALTKVARNILTNHKGYKVKSLNNDYVTVDKTYLDYVNKYECISLTKDNYNFCSYGIDAIKEQLKLDICQKTISHHINNANLINGYQVRDINAEPIIKQYLPDAERFIFTTPEDISFCRYGMEGLTEETGLNAKAVYPLMNPNSPRYGRKINGWSCVRANESTETRDKLLAEQALRLEQDKLINDAKKSWNGVRNKRYLLTNLITNEQLCCYGLVHLRELHGLDGSCLIKVIKGKIKHHKNWTCIKIENN
jgi:group I intron endonuclease